MPLSLSNHVLCPAASAACSTPDYVRLLHHRAALTRGSAITVAATLVARNIQPGSATSELLN